MNPTPLPPGSHWPPADDALSRKESGDALRQWWARTFAQGPIPRGRVEPATADLLRALFVPDYRWILRDCRHTVKAEPKDGWWEGLNAVSAMLARRLARGVGTGFPDSAGVDFDTFWRMFEANTRGMFGPGVPLHPIPANWTEDKAFMDARTRALETTDDGDPNDHARWALARLWDTFPIPLRYWADGAAVALLNACLAGEKRKAVELDTYRKDIRGDRGGLSLKPPANGKAVVSMRTRGPVFRVHRDRAREHGLCLTCFPASFPLADGTRLRFIFQG